MQNVEFEVKAMEEFIWWMHNNSKMVDKIWNKNLCLFLQRSL